MRRLRRSVKHTSSFRPDTSKRELRNASGAILIVGPLDRSLLAAAELMFRAHRTILWETTRDGAQRRLREQRVDDVLRSPRLTEGEWAALFDPLKRERLAEVRIGMGRCGLPGGRGRHPSVAAIHLPETFKAQLMLRG